MPQTLLALFALMLSSSFALQQSRHTLQSEMSMAQRDARTHAQGVASEVFAELGKLPFDEVTIAAEGAVAFSTLTPSPFRPELGEDGQAFGAMDDLDDVAGAGTHVVARTLTRPDGTLASLTFSVRATVSYASIQEVGGASVMAPTAGGTPSGTKLVTLEIRCLELEGGMWGSKPVLTVARPFSYTPAQF